MMKLKTILCAFAALLCVGMPVLQVSAAETP